METSFPLDFGATPVNESKVGNAGNSQQKMMRMCDICLKQMENISFVSGEDVHAEEPFFFGGFRRDSSPLPIPGPPGGSGPPNQMVRRLECFF